MAVKKRLLLVLIILVALGTVGYFIKSNSKRASNNQLSKPSLENTREKGVYALIGWNELPSDATWQKPFVDGVVIRTYWKDLNPQQKVYTWDYLDEQFSNSKKFNKKIKLVIAPGVYSPDWVLQNPKIEKALFMIPQGPKQGLHEAIPLPWDKTYLSLWFEFLNEISQRYGTNQSFVSISLTGPNSHNGEMSLPRERQDEDVWLSLVSQDNNKLRKNLSDAWKSTIDKYCEDFPNKSSALAIISKSLPTWAWLFESIRW